MYQEAPLFNANFDTQVAAQQIPLERLFVQNGLGNLTVNTTPVQLPEQPTKRTQVSVKPSLPRVNTNTSYFSKKYLTHPADTSYITPANTPSLIKTLPIESNESKPVLYANQQEFIKAMVPYATKVGQQLGIDPYMIIAQSAHETGWGKHAPDFNYFGIKGNGSSKPTHEYLNGQWVTVNAPFKGYVSMEDSVNGYGDFLLKNTRYQKALQAQDAMGFLQGLYDAGYATDPNYVSKVGSIYHKIRGV